MRVLVLLALLVGFARPAAADITLGAVTIRDASSNTVGRVDSDGTIRNSSNSSVGKIDKDGTVLLELLRMVTEPSEMSASATVAERRSRAIARTYFMGRTLGCRDSYDIYLWYHP